MVFLKAHISNREDDIHFLIKCLIEHIESDIRKAIGDEPLDADLLSGKKKIERTPKTKRSTLRDLNPRTTSKIRRTQERNKKLKEKELDELKIKDRPKKTETAEFAVYTEKDAENGKIPKGKKIGDRKPYTSIRSKVKPKDSKPEKMDSMKVSGEQIYQTVRSKQALQQLKELQSNPSIKAVLDRLKKPAFSFSASSNLSSKEKTELLEESLTAKNAGKTREVLRYVITALEAVKDTQDGGASKKSAAAIIDKIKEEDKKLKTAIKRSAPKNVQDNLAFSAPTLIFWNKLAKELKEVHVKIKFPLDENGPYNASVTKTLVDMGEGLVSFILDNIDKTVNAEKEVKIPPQFYEGKRLAPKDRMETAQEESYASWAASNSSKIKKEEKNARFIDMIDFTRFKNGRVKIRPRTIAYDDKTTGMSERNKNIEIIRTARDRKEFKEVSLSDIVKRYANYRKESSAKSKQKSDVKEIQTYMADRKKEIIASLDRKVRMPKVPKTLLAKYEKLNNEIVEDLKKYYAFTLRKNSIDIQEGDLKRIKNDSGYEMILAIREGPSDIGNQLKELVEVAKKAEDDKQKELDKETLDEYIRLGQSIVDLQEDYIDRSQEIEEFIAQGKQLKRIVDLVNYISLAKERYPQIKSAIDKLPDSKKFKSMLGRKDPKVRIKNLLNIKNNFEKEVIAKIKQFGGDRVIRNYSLDKENPSNFFISQLNEADLTAEMGEELEIEGLTTLYESASEERLREIFEFFGKYDDFEFFDDLKIDIDTQVKNLKRIQDKIEEIKIYFNHTTTEREEQQMLFEFIEIKAKKLRGEKVTDKSEMLKLLAERFRNNPVFTIEGKKITEYPEIAAYLEEKYEDVVGVDDGELKDFLDSAQESKEEEE